MPVFQVIQRAISTFLIKQAGFKRRNAQTSAIILVQRFGSTANLHIHLHCLVFDGVNRTQNGVPEFHRVSTPTAEQLYTLLDQIINRGRKQVTLPNGEAAKARPWDTATAPPQLALVRGHRWLAMLESGEVKSLREIAAQEGIDSGYVSRMVNLATLAPDIVAAILDDALSNHITLFDLAVDPLVLWGEQRAWIRVASYK